MISAHKRANPFVVAELPEDDVLMDVCSSHHKRSRWEENTPLRKRNLNQTLPPEPTFTLKDLERAREEGRMQAVNKLRALQTANEVLKQAMQEASMERDKFANDNKILKAGVVTLNNKNAQLARELEMTTNLLREECERSKALQSALVAVHANWSLGGCRKDDHMDSSQNFNGDVF